MATITQKINQLKSIDLDTAIPQILQQTAFEITALNQSQLYSGTDSMGRKISPKYKSKSYSLKKARMNPSAGYGTPDLFLNGLLYKGMGVIFTKDTFTIRSNVTYFSKLENYYAKNGSTVFKLSEKSKTEYRRGAFKAGLRTYLATKGLL